MNKNLNHETDQKLDTLLQDWAIRHALPPTQSASIRLAILHTPQPSLPAQSVAWWHRVFGTLDVMLNKSTDISRYLPYRSTGITEQEYC